jgi:hypothetical protein
MHVIAIDPGRESGYCYADIADKVISYHPFQAMDDVDELWRRLADFDPRFIVMEDFEFRRGRYSGSGGGGLDLFPVQLIGVTRLYECRGTSRLFLQKASTGKSYYSDPVLRQANLYERGKPHAMDASRHLLQWATFGFGNQFIGAQQDFAKLVPMEHFKKKT